MTTGPHPPEEEETSTGGPDLPVEDDKRRKEEKKKKGEGELGRCRLLAQDCEPRAEPAR